MVDVEADGVDGLQPELMYQIDVFCREHRGVRAEGKDLEVAAQPVGDQPRAQIGAARHAFPRLAEQPRLLGCRELARLADDDLGR